MSQHILRSNVLTRCARHAIARYAIWLALVLACTLCEATRARADGRPSIEKDDTVVRLLLPFELGHGPRFDGKRDGFGWVGQLSVTPGFQVGAFELSALGTLAYQRRIDGIFGARASLALIPIAQGTVAIRGALQGGYTLRHQSADGAAGLMVDLARLLRIGFWFGRDFHFDRFYALVTIGSDVTTWGDPIGAVIESGPLEDVGDGAR